MMDDIIPPQKKAELESIFSESRESPFANIDSNIYAWLSGEYGESLQSPYKKHILDTHKNNAEVIELLGGLENIKSAHLFTPQQIYFLAKTSLSDGPFLRNGFSNLFFVLSDKDTLVYIVGVVWNKNLQKFIPYTYRIENLYRSWSAGNQIFSR